MDTKSQYAVIALGLYFLESGFQHKSQIISYLLKLCKALPKAVWIDDIKANKKEKIPSAEKFAFCFNTLLSDISVFCGEYRDEIIQCQVEVMSNLTNLLVNCKDSIPPIVLCKATVPILLGLVRAMGRYTTVDGTPLLCLIFPKIELPTAAAQEKELLLESSHNSHMVRRTLSGTISFDSADGASSLKNAIDSFPYDITTFFFCKYGSSFNQFPYLNIEPKEEDKQRINIPINHLQAVFAIAKKILTKDTLEYLDGQACDVYNLHQISPYGYKSFSETINLVMVTLLRELLKYQRDLPLPFTKDVQEFVKTLFKIGTTEIQNRNETADKESKDLEAGVVNKYKITVLANAACVDLLVWAVADETEADKLCTRLYQKLCTALGHKVVVDHMPLLMVCLEGLGKLAKKFPNIAGTSIAYLRDFLVDPSPILTKLHSLAVAHQKKDRSTALYIQSKN